MAKAQPVQQIDPRVANLQARSIILQGGGGIAPAVDRFQQIAGNTLTGVIPGQQIAVPIRNVGLIKSFVIELEFTLKQAAAETLTRSKWGPANILSSVVLTDLNNMQRVNTTGAHLHALATARRQSAYGAAFTTDSPVAIGSNLGVISAPASITTVQTVRMFFEVPVSYSDTDLRGAIYAGVVNAQGQLQFTVNPNLVVGSAASDVLAAYKSSTANDKGTIENFKYKVYQNYLDQVPLINGQPILPMLDMSYIYMLNNTALTGMSAGQDFPVPYANFREFLSTMIGYDQGGTLNKGTDINYFALQTANFTDVWKKSVYANALDTRSLIGDDMPDGFYFFDHRKRPISTNQYGNMQLIVNPSSVAGASSQLLVFFEAMALSNVVTQASSLPAG